VLEVMDGEGGDDRVEGTRIRQRLGQVMTYELNAAILGVASASLCEHRLGDVKAHAGDFGTALREQCEQPSVAGAKVEDAAGASGHVVEQDAFSLGAVG
jgi:hypothetical protein